MRWYKVSVCSHAIRTSEGTYLHQCDVLPDLSLSSDRRHDANLLFAKCVNDAALTHVRIANHPIYILAHVTKYGTNDLPHRNLLTVAMKRAELSKESNERAFAEGVVNGGVEGYIGVSIQLRRFGCGCTYLM